jgi:hypothetical protein
VAVRQVHRHEAAQRVVDQGGRVQRLPDAPDDAAQHLAARRERVDDAQVQGQHAVVAAQVVAAVQRPAA